MELILILMCSVCQRAAAVKGEPPDQGCSEREIVVSRGGADDHTYRKVRARQRFTLVVRLTTSMHYSSESELERKLKDAEDECASLKKSLVSLSATTVSLLLCLTGNSFISLFSRRRL